MAEYYDKAFSLISSKAAREAFNIQAEPEKLRERYGIEMKGRAEAESR